MRGQVVGRAQGGEVGLSKLEAVSGSGMCEPICGGIEPLVDMARPTSVAET